MPTWLLRRSDFFWRNPLATAKFTRLTDFEGTERDADVASTLRAEPQTAAELRFFVYCTAGGPHASETSALDSRLRRHGRLPGSARDSSGLIAHSAVHRRPTNRNPGARHHRAGREGQES